MLFLLNLFISVLRVKILPNSVAIWCYFNWHRGFQGLNSGSKVTDRQINRGGLTEWFRAWSYNKRSAFQNSAIELCYTDSNQNPNFFSLVSSKLQETDIWKLECPPFYIDNDQNWDFPYAKQYCLYVSWVFHSKKHNIKGI